MFKEILTLNLMPTTKAALNKDCLFLSQQLKTLVKLSKEVCTPHVQWTSPTPAVFCSSEEHWSGRLET